MPERGEHYVTALQLNDIAAVIACRCGWLGHSSVDATQQWSQHLLEVLR